MRVTPEQLAMLIKKHKGKDAEIKELLMHVFSFPENIDSYSKFIFPHAFKVKHKDGSENVTNIPDFHREIYNIMFSKSNEAMAAPRGHAKSTIAGLFYTSWCIVNRMEDYVVYTSQSHQKTVEFLGPIRSEFKNNQRLRWLYGDLTPRSAKDDEGKDRDDCFDVNNIRVHAVSFEKNIRGLKYGLKRPSLIILDDIEKDERVLNPDLRKKDEHKLNSEIIPALAVHGRYKFIGTILHIDSLLMKKIKLLKGKIWTAINEEGDVLFPELYSKKVLMEIKEDIGSISFSQEYLNNPVDTTHSLIKREWIVQCFRPDISTEELTARQFGGKFCGVDFAFEDRITSDESAFCSIGFKDDFYYLLHVQKEKGWSVHEQMVHIKNSLHKKFQYDMIGLEENSIKAVSKDLDQYNLPLKLFWTGSADPAKRKTHYKDYDWSEKRHTVGKINLIMRLGTSFENKRWIIPYKTDRDKEVAHRVLAECTSYALADGKLVEAGVHPDIPIGLGYAKECADAFSSFVIDFG